MTVSIATVAASGLVPLHFRFRSGWRRPRAVAISEDLIAMVGPGGEACSIRLLAEPDDPRRSRIVYAVQGKPDFLLLAGDSGPVWASFQVTAFGFGRRAFGRGARRLTALAAVLAGILLAMTAWLAFDVVQRGWRAPVGHHVVDYPQGVFEL